MVLGKLASVLFEHIRAFFVLPQFEEILGEKEDGLECGLWLSNVDMVLFVRVGVAGDETLDKERLANVAFGGDAEQQLSNPELSNDYHLAE